MRKKNNRKIKLDIQQQHIKEEKFTCEEYKVQKQIVCSNNVPEAPVVIKSSLDTPPTPTNSNAVQSQESILNVSDASTVDADESDYLADGKFSYLQNLNSGNLMKFSQQSAMERLMEEQMDIKSNINLIPTCEEHDSGGYNFQIKVNCMDNAKERRGVIFSKETQRLYLKTDENVYIDCFYTQKMPIQPLRVRIFVVFDKDTGDPVLRCQNHISKDTDTNDIIRRSLVRCKNPHAIYYGSDTGKSIKERYSVVVPLNTTVKGNETNQLKQQLITSFSCYNSCMSRKQTAMIFLLENMNGEILAQRTLAIKISTCPKRDSRTYEATIAGCSNKRKHAEESSVSLSKAKIRKYDESSLGDEYSRSSCDEATSEDDTRQTVFCSLKNKNETDGFIFAIYCKSREEMLRVIANTYTTELAHDLRERTRNSGHVKRFYDQLLN